MNEIVLKQNKLTSLQLAEITGRTHSHILRDIRNMEKAWYYITGTKFGFSEYIDASGKKNPDEVWLGRTDEDKGNNIKTIDNYIFIKHYQDQTIAVAGNVKNDNLQLKTWFPVLDKKVRRGLLIKK